MDFPTALIEGCLLRRYKRFLADIELPDGSTATAHVPNSGTMIGVDAPGSRVLLSRAANPKRKLPYTLEMIEADGCLVGVNTSHPNRLVADAISAGLVPELEGYKGLRREVKYGRNSRIDLLLETPDRPPCYVEVKNVHMRRPHRFDGMAAEFPDAVTARGTKHLRELMDMVAAGNRAVMFYLVQRNDCRHFALADDIDPTYAAALTEALAAGVEAICYACALTPGAIRLDRRLEIRVAGRP